MENLFENNVVIDEHNKSFRKGEVAFRCETNQNADRKTKDINEKINRLRPDMIVPNACEDKSSSDSSSESNDSNHKHRRVIRATESKTPKTKDWKSSFSSPRDQGSDCGR